MKIVCIDFYAWESLKQQIERLTSEMKALKELYCSNPRDG